MRGTRWSGSSRSPSFRGSALGGSARCSDPPTLAFLPEAPRVGSPGFPECRRPGDAVADRAGRLALLVEGHHGPDLDGPRVGSRDPSGHLQGLLFVCRLHLVVGEELLLRRLERAGRRRGLAVADLDGLRRRGRQEWVAVQKAAAGDDRLRELLVRIGLGLDLLGRRLGRGLLVAVDQEHELHAVPPPSVAALPRLTLTTNTRPPN